MPAAHSVGCFIIVFRLLIFLMLPLRDFFLFVEIMRIKECGDLLNVSESQYRFIHRSMSMVRLLPWFNTRSALRELYRYSIYIRIYIEGRGSDSILSSRSERFYTPCGGRQTKIWYSIEYENPDIFRPPFSWKVKASPCNFGVDFSYTHCEHFFPLPASVSSIVSPSFFSQLYACPVQ